MDAAAARTRVRVSSDEWSHRPRRSSPRRGGGRCSSGSKLMMTLHTLAIAPVSPAHGVHPPLNGQFIESPCTSCLPCSWRLSESRRLPPRVVPALRLLMPRRPQRGHRRTLRVPMALLKPAAMPRTAGQDPQGPPMGSQRRCLKSTGFTRTAMLSDRISSPRRDRCHDRQTAAQMPPSIAALHNSSAPAQPPRRCNRAPRLTPRPATAPAQGQNREKGRCCQLLQADHPTSRSLALRTATCRRQTAWTQPPFGQYRLMRPLPPLSHPWTQNVLALQAATLLQEV